MSAGTSHHPALFAVLSAPFGLASGFVVVVLTYVLTKIGVPLGDSSALMAWYVAPRVFGFLWAPVVDLVGPVERWYLVTCGLAALSLVLIGHGAGTASPGTFLVAAVVLGGTALATMAMAGESLLARASGKREQIAAWFQAGTLGGGALGGGGGLWLAEATRRPDLAAAGVGVAMMLSAAAFLRFRIPSSGTEREPAPGFRGLLLDVLALSRTRGGRLVALTVVLPIATGAAGNLWAGVADEYHVSAGTVALVTGTLASAVSAIGALAGGRLCRQASCLSAYLYTSLAFSAVTLLMALARTVPTTFVIGTLVYAFLNGVGYAAFTGAVLEVIGSTASATKYNLFAALAYAPISAMTAVEGKAHDLFGTTGLLWTETLAGLGAVACVVWVRGMRPSAPSPEAAA